MSPCVKFGLVMRKMQTSSLLSLSPSFNSYSSSTGHLADIAARVVSELRRENNGSDSAFFLDDDEDHRHHWFNAELDQSSPLDHEHDHHHDDGGEDEDDDDEDEFEFAFVCRESVSSPISADEIFYNGQIKPVYYPLFGKNLILEEHVKGAGNDAVVVSGTDKVGNDKSALPPPQQPPPPPRRRQPLRKLMVEEERERATSWSSSEADENAGLQHGTYCVWTPRNGGAGAGARGGKKSKSTGSSKRWKIRDLLGGSNRSDRRKDRTIVVIAAPSKKVSKGDKADEKGTATAKDGAENDVVSAAAERAGKDEDKRKSYKHDLVGFLANVNGLSRNLHPF